MFEYRSTVTIQEAAGVLGRLPEPLLLLTHAKPDGDAFGSVIALAAALGTLGREVTPCFAPPVPATLLNLRGSGLSHIHEPQRPLPAFESCVVLDTGAWSQLGPLAELVRPRLERTLLLDHHISGDIEAKYRHIDSDAAATAEIVAELIHHLLAGQTPDRETRHLIAESLFVGIASDTGWFRFSNTRPRTHELAAELLGQGVDQAALYQVLEQSERPAKLELTKRALNNLQYTAGGQGAIIALRARDFHDTGALPEETERVIDLPQQVGAIRAIALVSEAFGMDNNHTLSSNGRQDEPDEPIRTRISFRSKPGPNAVNVAELAGQFGGGGHARAAGAKLTDPIDTVLPRVEQAMRNALGGGRAEPEK